MTLHANVNHNNEQYHETLEKLHVLLIVKPVQWIYKKAYERNFGFRAE